MSYRSSELLCISTAKAQRRGVHRKNHATTALPKPIPFYKRQFCRCQAPRRW